MSTKATIGLTLPNEMIVCIYCYRDGYPEHLGRILAKHCALRHRGPSH